MCEGLWVAGSSSLAWWWCRPCCCIQRNDWLLQTYCQRGRCSGSVQGTDMWTFVLNRTVLKLVWLEIKGCLYLMLIHQLASDLSLLQGLWPNYLKVVPSIAIMFVCYENVRSYSKNMVLSSFFPFHLSYLAMISVQIKDFVGAKFKLSDWLAISAATPRDVLSPWVILFMSPAHEGLEGRVAI